MVTLSRTTTQMLIVEDDDAHAELIELALEETALTNPRVRVETGEQALEEIQSRSKENDPPQFGLIMLDLKLPGISGLDVLQVIRADPTTRFVPVVMLSTSINERDRDIAYRYGVNSYVQKPLDAGMFHQVVQDLQMYWCIHNVPHNGGEPGASDAESTQ